MLMICSRSGVMLGMDESDSARLPLPSTAPLLLLLSGEPLRALSSGDGVGVRDAAADRLVVLRVDDGEALQAETNCCRDDT
jgi:hypothetical protein